MGEISWTNHYELFHWLIEIEYIWEQAILYLSFISVVVYWVL